MAMETNGISSTKGTKQNLLALVEEVQREAKIITDFCNTNGVSSPSLSRDWPDDLPENIQASRMKLREAANAVHDIAVGPFNHLFSLACSVRFLTTPTYL